jgi:biopolymer transport protein ExbD
MAATLAHTNTFSTGDLPLAELNTTPLIDVLLVLLVLFIITIPPATHALQVELPSGPGVVIDRASNTVTVTAGQAIEWNGKAVSLPQLTGLLRATGSLPVEPELRFAPDGAANYALTAEVLRTIKASGVTAFGFVGNERHASFGKR